jgi:hypothetical protein
MKFIFLSGGAIGFTLAAATSWWLGRPPERVLLDGSIGCLACGLLFRWYWNVCLGGIRDAYLARQQTAAAAPAPAPVKPTKT